MRLLPSDPDVATIVARIRNGDINLQPEFQRGEVWSKVKKQRLVDSILRDWHVPPIHVIENSRSRKQEVLDGQQRLAAIRDFVEGVFPVDGSVEPLEPSIQSLHGQYYWQLAEEWRRRFDQFTIRVFRIVDYQSSEPAELFFRLNQPASLTGAEQRNAFFGPVREQIRALVTSLEGERLNKTVLGFSNSRMAYDDVLARTALAIERRTIAEKITSGDLAELYRTDQPLSAGTVDILTHAARTLGRSLQLEGGLRPKFNKATLFSWLVFLVRFAFSQDSSLSPDILGDILTKFERSRHQSFRDTNLSGRVFSFVPRVRLFAIYDSRSSARVADVSSVILRDAVIWLVVEGFLADDYQLDLEQFRLERIHLSFSEREGAFEEDYIARSLVGSGWGQLG